MQAEKDFDIVVENGDMTITIEKKYKNINEKGSG